MPTKPTPAALAAAKSLYPLGVATYCYRTDEENRNARERDWAHVASKIDAAMAGEHKELVDALAALVERYAEQPGTYTPEGANARALLFKYQA